MNAAEIEAAAEAAGLARLSLGAAEKLHTYLELLLKWNSKLNLTAVREPGEIIRRHLVESMQCAQLLPGVSTLLDFGSGAGLPGIPIAVLRPEIRVTLGESQGKKAAFLREAVRELELNAEVFNGRIEAMPPGRVFDAVTLRAVDRMAVACRQAQKRIRTGGWLILFATADTKAELTEQLTGITWGDSAPIFDLKRGIVLMGQKDSTGSVPRGTSQAR